MTLTEFLLARIAEDEARWQDYGEHDHNDYGPHPAPWSRLLAECEAKRRILSLCAPTLGDNMRGASGVWDEAAWKCGQALQALALPYADHPSFQEEWRP